MVLLLLLFGSTTWVLKKYQEKSRYELDNNATCCFKKILKVTPHKTAAIRTLASHRTNHQSKRNETGGSDYCRNIKDELISHVLLWTKRGGHTSFDRQARTYIHQLRADTWCCLENLPWAMDGRDRLRERERKWKKERERWYRVCVCVCVWVSERDRERE